MRKQIPRLLLEDMVTVQFRRHSKHLFVKTQHIQEFHEMPFLKDKFNLVEPEPLKEPRGIDQAKKDDIVNKLGSLMPENRLAFWKSLPVNNKSKDLADHFN